AGTLSARDTLEMATRNGAYTVGLEDRVGSLTPGKQADIVLIDATAPGTAPMIDPVAAVTLSADVSNVDTVIIGGKVHKQHGKLPADFAKARGLVEGSRDYLMEETAKRRAQCPPRATSSAEPARRGSRSPRGSARTPRVSAAGRWSTRTRPAPSTR